MTKIKFFVFQVFNHETSKKNLFSNKIESSGVECKRVFKMIKGNKYGMNKLAPKIFSTTKCIWAKRRRVSKRILKNLSGNSFVVMINSHRTKSKSTNGMLQSFSRDSLQNRQTSPRTQRENWRNLFAKWLTKSKRSRDNIATTNSDFTTITAAATTCFKIVRWRNARLERETTRSQQC